MEVFTTRAAAERASVTVRRWHYLTSTHNIQPITRADGPRGAMVWDVEAVEEVARLAAIGGAA